MTALQALFGLDGKTALVTGAAKGIGRGCAETLAKAGAAVACADVDLEGAQTAAKEIEAAGGRALAVSMDCGDEASIVQGFAESVAALGRLDVLVNNAGIFPPAMIEIAEAELFDQVHRVNLRGTFLCLREGVKAIHGSSDGGAIVNIASIDGLHPSFPGLALYGSSKGGIIQLTRNAALEFSSYRITVNVICPGPVRTDGTAPSFDAGIEEFLLQRMPLGRVGTPEDVAAMVLALASPAGRFVTGATLVVDGGYLLT